MWLQARTPNEAAAQQAESRTGTGGGVRWPALSDEKME